MNIRDAISEDERAAKNLLEAYALESDFNPQEFIVAEEKGEVVGCVRLKSLGGFYELCSLAVEKGFQGQGVGYALVKEALGRSKGKPVYCLIRKPDFFRRHGFRQIERHGLPEDLGGKIELCESAGGKWTGMVRV